MATLRITLEGAWYRVLYVVKDNGGAAMPIRITEPAKLKALLQQFNIDSQHMEVILAGVEAGTGYVIDVGHVARDTISHLLDLYAG